MKKSLISSHFAHHRPRDKLVTYYLNCEGGQIKMPKEALDDYMARYCANSTAWRSCTIARALLPNYERKERHDKQAKDRRA